MADDALRERLRTLEKELESLKEACRIERDNAALQERLRKLEKDLEKNKGPYWVEILKAILPPLISGLAILVAGYWLTGSVNNAFQKRQLQLSNAKEMQALLRDFYAGKEEKELNAMALALSTFGEPAIGPLLYVLDTGDEFQILAAAEGLKAIGLVEPPPVCEQLSSVLQDRTGRFTWITHWKAIQLGGELKCENFSAVLEGYNTLLTPRKGGLATYSGIVREEPAPDEGSLGTLRQVLENSQRLFKQRASAP